MAEQNMPPEEAAASEYPLSMRQVLFSFKGRITRREFWMKGLIPMWLGVIVIGALLSAANFYTSGQWLFEFKMGYEVRPGSIKPVLVFNRDGNNIIGAVNRMDTGAAFADSKIVFDKKTKYLVRNYLVGTQPLRVSMTSTGTPEKPNYRVDLLWAQYPGPLPKQPPTLLAKVLTAVLAVFYVLMIWPYAALLVKRFHDRDNKGWWALLFFIPLVNLLLLAILGSLRGTDGENRFGPDPLEG